MNRIRTGCLVALALMLSLTINSGCSGDSQQPSERSRPRTAGTAKIHYYYDGLGRLVQATSSDGTGVHYAYDPVGNITAVRRLNAGALSVVDFVPREGSIGTAVTIYGSGFDATAEANTVTFNGTAAVVASVTDTTLTVTVPDGASSGKIAVSNTLGIAASTTNFVVSGAPSTPVIAAFTPVVAAVGAMVTVSGANFQSDARDDKIEIGEQPAQVVTGASGPTPTELKFVVPNATVSGPVTLTTPFGKAVSAAEFFAVPASVNPGDVEFASRLSAGGPAVTVTTSAPGKKAVLIFEANANQGLHLASQGGNFASAVTAEVYDSIGTKIETLSLNNSSVADFSKLLANNDTYSIILTPSASDHGTIQVSLIADSAFAVNGTTTVNLAQGRNTRFILTTPANTEYGLAIAGLSFTPSGGSLGVVVRRSDGAFAGSCSFNTSGSCTLPSSAFVTGGLYMVTFSVTPTNAASFSATLSTDTTGTIPLDGDPTLITIGRAGQNARYSFSGTAGQLLTLVLTGNTLDDGNPSTNNSTTITVFKPSGGTLKSTTILTIAATSTLDISLTETGIYTIAVDPDGLDSGTINAQIKSYATGVLTVDGSTPVNLTAGQNGRFTFTAQANTGYGLALAGLTFTPSAGLLTVVLRKGDGTSLDGCQLFTSGTCNFAPTDFATTGTYFIDFDPSGINTASLTAVLSTDATGTIPLDSDPVTVTIARSGQNARYSFAGTAAQMVTLVLTNNMLDDGDPKTNNDIELTVFGPSGATIFGRSINTSTTAVPLDLVLPTTGSYTLLIDPAGPDSGTINAQLKSLLTGIITPDVPLPVDLSAGRNARFTFTADAGKGYGLAVANLTITPSGGELDVTVKAANGTSLLGIPFFASNSADVAPGNFATAGTYILEFNPTGLNTASFTATLSSDVTGTLTIGAAVTTVTTTRAGQNARYSFAGTAGQAVRVVLGGNSIDDGNPATSTSTAVSVFKPSSPSAAPISSGTFGPNGLTLSLTLPESGSYTIFVSPSGLDSGSFNLSVQ